MTKADGGFPIRREFSLDGLPVNTARRHFFVGPVNTARRHFFVGADTADDDPGDAPVWCAGGGDRLLHPSLYPFCPDAARRRLPGEIAAVAGTRGRHGVALYPSSCAVCRYKRGYNAAVMSKARWKYAVRRICGSDI